MFTLKFYSHDNSRTRIYEAESLTVLRFDGNHEITLHQRVGDDFRVDLSKDIDNREAGWPPVYDNVIIENANGKTTEIIYSESALNVPIPKAA